MKGKLHVYTGNGKGKTTAAMGLALRSLGHGRRVLIAQFLKDGRSGELAALCTFEQATIYPAKPISGFVFAMSPEEKEEAKKDMGRMLDYIDKLNELDTTGVEPMSHVFPVNNVFREDVVTNGDDRDEILANAPAKKDGAFMVPKTVE